MVTRKIHKDFFLGCQHVDYSNIFLVGFARPIIGNIPSISENKLVKTSYTWTNLSITANYRLFNNKMLRALVCVTNLQHKVPKI